MVDCIAKLLPLFIFYIFLAFPDDFLYASITPLGRFIAVSIILFYSFLDTYRGIVMCFIVIFYYSLNSVEKTSGFDSLMLIGNNVSPLVLQENFESESEFKSDKNMDEFRENNCENGALKYKNNRVHNENAEHIFPELEFEDETCNPCDKYCGITINERLKIQEDMVYPKSNDNWVMNIWKTWFSNDNELSYIAPAPYSSNK